MVKDMKKLILSFLGLTCVFLIACVDNKSKEKTETTQDSIEINQPDQHKTIVDTINFIKNEQNDFEGYYSNDKSYIKVVKHDGKYFALSNMFTGELELHTSENNKKTDFYVEFMAGDGLTSISISFGKEPNGNHYLLFAFDVADYASLMRRVDAKLPAKISEWFIKQNWENPCNGFTQPIMMDFFDINGDGNSDYIYWEVGCPDTRGRGEAIVFDGKTGILLFQWFGYEVTGGYERKDIVELYSQKKINELF